MIGDLLALFLVSAIDDAYRRSGHERAILDALDYALDEVGCCYADLDEHWFDD